MSLRDGKKKMSKSEESDFSRINLQDSEDDIEKKIKKAKTDSHLITSNKKDLEKRPEALNLLNIYSSVTKTSLETTLKEMEGKDFSKFKKKLADVLIASICPIGKKIKELNKDKHQLLGILRNGTEKAKVIADKNLKEIKQIVGFI